MRSVTADCELSSQGFSVNIDGGDQFANFANTYLHTSQHGEQISEKRGSPRVKYFTLEILREKNRH